MNVRHALPEVNLGSVRTAGRSSVDRVRAKRARREYRKQLTAAYRAAVAVVFAEARQVHTTAVRTLEGTLAAVGSTRFGRRA